jgi:hypothetical protein
MYRPKNYPIQRHYLPELTYGRPGIRIVLGRLLKGGSTIQETKIGSSVCYEVPCTDEQWQTALWCSGVDPAVVTVEASNSTPVTHPYRPYVRIDWHDRQGKLARIVRLVDGATMWSGYTVYIRPDAQVPARGFRSIRTINPARARVTRTGLRCPGAHAAPFWPRWNFSRSRRQP